MFLLNTNGHYFEIDTAKVPVTQESFQGCRFFDDEKTLLETVCAESDLDLEDIEGTTFYVTERDGQPVVIDDRGFATAIDEPVEAYLSEFAL